MKKINILLADDIEGWLFFTKQNLQKFLHNFDVNYYLFETATQAYNFALQYSEKIDIVITDLEMEPMEKLAGEWLIENLKTIKSTQNAKYLIISSSFDISFIAQRTAADGYLRKVAYQSNPLLLQYKLQEFLGGL